MDCAHVVFSGVSESGSALMTDEQKQLGADLEENRPLRLEVERLQSLLVSSPPSAANDSSKVPPDAARVIQAFEALRFVLKECPCFVAYSGRDLRYLYARCLNKRKAGEVQEDCELEDTVPEARYLRELQACALRSGVSERQELHIPVNGKMRNFIMLCEPFYKEGRVDGIVSVSVEVTSQLAMEKHISNLESELTESRMQLKEYKLVEELLRKRIEAADRAIEAKNSFLAVMSHEIRTPLNGVLGMAQLLATTFLNQEQKELVDAMIFSGDVILAIISDILDLSKIESGTMKLEEREFNPRDAVKHVVKAAVAASKNPGVNISSEIAEDVPMTVIYLYRFLLFLLLILIRVDKVVGDLLRVKQVITNLVFNAVKFTRKGHIRIHVKPVRGARPEIEDFAITRSRAQSARNSRAAAETADVESSSDLPLKSSRTDLLGEDNDESRSMPEQSRIDDEFDASAKLPKVHSDPGFSGPEFESNLIWLQFAVEDTGIGIPEEAFPSLFEKFTQVHSSTTRKYGGTGLGLAICKQLVELMGGRISVSSKVGAGSTFVFTVCCMRRPRPDQRHRPASSTAPSREYKDIHKLQAELANTVSCPLADILKVEFGSDKAKKQGVFPLQRTFSGPPRIECTINSDISDLGTLGGRLRQPRITPRILLAEDNKVNVMVALSMLKKIGLSAELAYNGQQALEAIRTKKYDLVLMDVCMPVLDGLEVTRRVRLFERTGSWDESHVRPEHLRELRERLPIVAMTANVSLDFQEQCLQHGMDSFLTKPISFCKLRDVLLQYLWQEREV